MSRKKPQTEEQHWERFDERVEACRDQQLFETKPTKPMGMMKRYLENIVCLCSPHKFGQDAVEWAILSGHVKLAFNQQEDLINIMGQPGKPETGLYDTIIEEYQTMIRDGEMNEKEALLLESYAALVDAIKKAA
jgi:hypothetical protein